MFQHNLHVLKIFIYKKILCPLNCVYNAIITSDTVSKIKILNPFFSKIYAGTIPVWVCLFQRHFHACKHRSSYYTSSCLHKQGKTTPYKVLHYYLIQSHKNTISWKPICHNILTIIGWPHILHDSKKIYKKKYFINKIYRCFIVIWCICKIFTKKGWDDKWNMRCFAILSLFLSRFHYGISWIIITFSKFSMSLQCMNHSCMKCTCFIISSTFISWFLQTFLATKYNFYQDNTRTILCFTILLADFLM